MKKIIAVLLSLTIVFTSFAASAAVVETGLVTGDITEYPVIIVPGYSACSLIYGEDRETGEHVWGINMDLIIERLLARIADLGIGLGIMSFDNAEYIASVVGEEFAVMFEKIRCNPDGSSVYPIKREITTAEQSNSLLLMESNPDGEHQHEIEIAAEIAHYIGYKNIYNFQSDFRMGAEVCATMLDEYIQTVKKHSGKDKVNIFSLSHGGQVTATYLNLFGYKGDVDNAVMTVPAIGGAGIAYDAIMESFDFDEECLFRFIENGTMMEENMNWLVKAQQLGFLDNILDNLAPHIKEILGYWGSIWDFIPLDKYEEAKEFSLDPVASAELIKKSDRYHYEILASMPEKFAECIENGMNISIISGTGNRIVSGLNENSDGIITTTASTGATCAPCYERFADGYVQINDCNGKNKVSPAMDIDASTAYMPDNTWFVDNLYHGMTYKDDYSRELMMTLLLTDNITDVYSNPRFPQFKDSTNPSLTVYAEFEGCTPGFIDSNAKNLVVTNTSKTSKVRISAVDADGIDLKFKVSPFKQLAPGESIVIPFSGDIPEISRKSARITVYYSMDTVTPIGYRTQGFTICNGDPVEKEDGYRSAEAITPFDILIGDGFDKILRHLGLKEVYSMFYTIMYYWFINIFSF